MANTVKIKMKCTALRPASVGADEMVTLERQQSLSTSEDNTRTANLQTAVSGKLELPISRGSAGKGQFILGMTYAVSFTEVLLEGV